MFSIICIGLAAMMGFRGKLLYSILVLVTDEVWFNSREYLENIKFKMVPTIEQGFYNSIIRIT
jgi:hypothetical protein